MATLVLTGLGTAVGGPIGGAIGGLLGNAIDHATWARPKGRTGPRLTELRVQTSSYGSVIPLLFGTMRVAGTVIWSTDLIESRGRAGGGKGQPATTTYSYSASFAVLLSARAIRGVGRIWADGKLLRGAAGDMKAAGVLRVHSGGEDQAVDPLIASADPVTPAYRGMAYAVFEGLALADFGNRIPSLTFEVIADDGAVTVGAIGAACAAVTGGGTVRLAGFAASGTARDVLALMAQAGGGWWAADGDGLRWHQDGGTVLEIADPGVSAPGLDGAARQRTTAPSETVPGAVTVGHYDPARDWQAGLQRARALAGSRREERVEMPAAMSADAARTLAEAILARARTERVRRVVTLGLDGLTIAPGQSVRIAGETGRWRVVEAALEGMAVRLALVPVAPATLPVAGAGGRIVAAADDRVGATRLVLAETPALDDDLPTQPRLTVIAAGEGRGWRSAALLWSVDDGASWTPAGGTAAPGVIGTVEVSPGDAPATVFDMAGTIVVRLVRADMMLADADDAALDRGANLAVAGGELVQFGRAEPMGGGRWRLSRLLRGRRATGRMATGDPFALLEAETARTIDLPVAAMGRTVRVLATGSGDGAAVAASLRLDGASLRPPAPVGGRVERLATGGATVRWTRRSRLGWRWLDGIDVPLGEEREGWRVVLTRGATVEERSVDTAMLVLSAAECAGGVAVTVRQRGMWGDSPPLTIMVGE